MHSKRGFTTIGTGGGMSFSGKGLEMLSITFECDQNVNIKQARELIVECIRAYLNDINETKELKNYLNPFPFTCKNVNITIHFVDRRTQAFKNPPVLAMVGSLGENLSYWTNPNPHSPLREIQEETYEEACALWLKHH